MPDENFHYQISRELGAINEKLNALPKIEQHLTILNGRTRKLENWQLKINSKTTLIATIVSGFGGFVVWVVSLFV